MIGYVGQEAVFRYTVKSNYWLSWFLTEDLILASNFSGPPYEARTELLHFVPNATDLLTIRASPETNNTIVFCQGAFWDHIVVFANATLYVQGNHRISSI